MWEKLRLQCTRSYDLPINVKELNIFYIKYENQINSQNT